jgi:hypothetical protein
MPEPIVEILRTTKDELDEARKCLESLKSVISVLEKMGQIPDKMVDACVEEKPDGKVIYIVTGINGYSRDCKSLPEASQALIEAGHHKESTNLEHANKSLVGMDLGSGVITANKDYRFVIDLLATALIGAGVGAILGKMFKIEIKRAVAVGALSATSAKLISDKVITYE